MRRLPALLVIGAACGAVLSLGTLAALVSLGPAAARGVPPVAHALAGLGPGPAVAQEVMEFKPVPAESLTELERPRARRAPAAAPAPAAPPAPSVPPVPPVPPVPDSDTGKSGDVVRFGSDIHIPAGQTVEGDVVAMGGDVTVSGHVEGDVVAMGGDVTLHAGAQVDGQVVTLGGQLREEPGSHIGGQRVSAGGLPRGWFGWPFLGFIGIVGSGIKALAWMLFVLLVAWGFTQLAPNRTRVAFDALKREPLMCFGVGLLAWALIIPSIVALALVVAILCITIIGIPLALAVVLGYVLALALLLAWGYVVGAAALGERLAQKLGRPAASLTLMAVWGVVALTLVKVVGHLFGGIPMGGMAGGLLVFLAQVTAAVLVTMGAGALLRTQVRREAMRQWWPGPKPAPGGEAAPVSASPAASAPVGPAAPSMPPEGSPPAPGA